MDETTYLALSATTESSSYHSENVPAGVLENVLYPCIRSASWLDRVKRALFYGAKLSHTYPCSPDPTIHHRPELAQLVHGIMGIFTEAGELLEHLYDVLKGAKELDRVNLIEELGDLYWYAALLHRITGSLPSDAWRANIKKLEARYPQGFNADRAYNRDTGHERTVLEQHAGKQEETG